MLLFQTIEHKSADITIAKITDSEMAPPGGQFE